MRQLSRQVIAEAEAEALDPRTYGVLPRPLSMDMYNRGLRYFLWITVILGTLFTGAATVANRLLSRARHLRVNQQTPGEIKLDDKGAIEDMARRGATVGRDSFDAVRFRFLDGFHATDWRN